MDAATITLWLDQAQRDDVISPGFRPEVQRKMFELMDENARLLAENRELLHAVECFRSDGMCNHASGNCGELCPWCEIDRLSRWVCDLQAGMYINCVYCGHRYGPDDEVKATMQQALYDHISVCPKHPLSQAIREWDEARDAARHLSWWWKKDMADTAAMRPIYLRWPWLEEREK